MVTTSLTRARTGTTLVITTLHVLLTCLGKGVTANRMSLWAESLSANPSDSFIRLCNIIESPIVRDLLSSLDPKHVLSTRNTIDATVLPAMAKKVRPELGDHRLSITDFAAEVWSQSPLLGCSNDTMKTACKSTGYKRNLDRDICNPISGRIWSLVMMNRHQIS